MKKLFILLLIGINSIVHSMECPTETRDDSAEDRAGIEQLPDELLLAIFSFVPETINMRTIFRKFSQLARVSRRFNSIAEDNLLIGSLAEEYITFHRIEALKEFCDAARKHHSKVVKALNAVRLNLQDDQEYKCACAIFFLAAKEGHTEIMELLLNNGISVNLTSGFGEAALISASENGHKNIVQLLIDRKVRLNLQDASEHQCACKMFFLAAAAGHKEIMELFINNDIPIDLTNDDGESALIIASGKGHKNVVQLLIDYGADVNIAAHRRESMALPAIFKSLSFPGETALMMACYHGRIAIVKILINSGADRSAINSDGDTAGTYARRAGYNSVASLLD